MDILCKGPPPCHLLFSIIQACKSFMDKDWSCHIQHAFWESNKVADRMAFLGHSLGFGTTIFNSPPHLALEILKDDFNGVTFARLCSSS